MIALFERLGTRPIMVIISAVVLMFFVVPFSAGIVNIGNCFGAAVMTLLTVYFMFSKIWNGLIGKIWQRPFGKPVLCVCGAVIVSGIVLALVISAFMWRAARKSPSSGDTTIVVLGCKVKDGRPSLMLRRRLDAAYDYLCDNESAVAVLSGGKGDDELISEAQCMYNYLTERGIASERLIIEDKSVSTYENLKNSKEIIEDKGLNEDMTLVTDGYHQLRAQMIADKLGIETYAVSAETGWLLPTYVVREWFGVTYQFVFG